jgi:hypothetical protein
MWLLRNIAAGLRGLFRKKQTERELNEELHAYLESAREEKMRAGLSSVEALRAARVEIGSLEAVKDGVRAVGWEVTVESLWQDLRYGIRTLRRSPAFTLAAVFSLALGIGANTAIFSVLNAVLLKVLPVREPARLVQLEETYKGDAFNFFSYPTYLRLRDNNQVFASLFGWAIRDMNLSLYGEVEAVAGMFVTGSYYSGLDVPALIGRTILPEDERPGADPVAVLYSRMAAGRSDSAATPT